MRALRAERQKAEQLRQQSLQFDVALNNMSQGLVMFDAAERLVLCNQRYIELSGLSLKFMQSGRTLREILERRKAQGNFSRDVEEYRHELLEDIAHGITKSIVIETDAGRWHSVVNVPMAEGGWVATHEDITEQVVAKRVIEKQALQLDAALENMSQGLCMFDAKQRLIVCNKRYAELYELPDDLRKPGTPLRAILERHIAVGKVQEDPENFIMRRLSEASNNKSYQIINRLRDGRLVSVVHRPMADGGWVATHEDVTEAKAREESFRLLFEGNPVPMWVTDRATLRFVAVNEAAISHYGYTREQFMAMTAPDLRPAADRDRFANYLRALPKIQLTENIGQHWKSDGAVIDVLVFSCALNYAGRPARLAVAHDITKVTLAKNELRRTKKFLDTVIEHVPLPIIVKDVAGLDMDARNCRFTLFNRAYEELTGDSRTELIGKTAHQIYPKERAELIVQGDIEALRSGQAVTTSEHPIQTRNGERLVTATKSPIRDENGEILYLLTVMDDVTERRRTEQHISYLAYTDLLTDLPNRATFIEFLAKTIDNAAERGEQFAVLCVDLDQFKEANDVYGHLVGDALLREAARRLQPAANGNSSRVSAVTNSRWSCRAAAAGRAPRRLASVCWPRFKTILKSTANAASGIEHRRRDLSGRRPRRQKLIANADAALYQAKAEAARFAVVVRCQAGGRLQERREMQNGLKRGVSRDEFFLHYQPQQKMATGRDHRF